jgi:hypothetical protein
VGAPYEGESYLGFGALSLLAAAAYVRRREIDLLLRRHAALVAFITACTAFALSDRVVIGPWQIVDLPMLPWMAQAAAIMRASGRFIWPLVYVLTLIPALLLMTRVPRRAWLVALGLAAAVQTIEAWPIRQMATMYSRTVEPDVIGRERFEAWLDEHARVWQYPSWFCGGLGRGSDVRHTAVRRETQIQLLAARRGMPTNSMYMARRVKDCEREAGDARALRMDDGTFYVFSLDAVAQVPRLRELAATPACESVDWAIVCTTSWSQRAWRRVEHMRALDGDTWRGASDGVGSSWIRPRLPDTERTTHSFWTERARGPLSLARSANSSDKASGS